MDAAKLATDDTFTVTVADEEIPAKIDRRLAIALVSSVDDGSFRRRFTAPTPDWLHAIRGKAEFLDAQKTMDCILIFDVLVDALIAYTLT